MQLSNAPTKLPLAFAVSGGKNSIPVASQIGITPGAASLTDGFPPLTRTPLAAGGVPPSGLDMNGVLFEISAITRWANAGAGYVYDGTFAADSNVNGYPKGARILRTDGLGYWLNTTDNNTTDPETSSAATSVAAGWVPDYTSGATSVTMTNANVTLTSVQYSKPIIVISGALVGNLNLIFPDTVTGQWMIINNTTGAFAITCKTASGTGVVVKSVQKIVSDGTNIKSGMSDMITAMGALISSAGGTADALTGTFSPVPTSYVNGVPFLVRAASANATTTPTFTPNSGTLTAKTIVKGNNQALAAADIAGAGHWLLMQYDSGNDNFVLLNPATGVSTISLATGDARYLKLNASNGPVTGALTFSAAISFSSTVAVTSTAAIGASTTTSQALRIFNSLTGNVAQYGVNLQPVFGSDATTAGSGYYVGPSTTAAAYTMANAYGVYVDDWTKGAGSTITNQYGLFIANQTKGGTNYAIKTGTGLVSFGGNTSVTGTITSTANATFGDGVTSIVEVKAKGPATGSDSGAAVYVVNNLTTIIGMANKSAVVGGAYDATPYIYASAIIEISKGITSAGIVSSTVAANHAGFAATASDTTKAAYVTLNSNGATAYILREGTTPILGGSSGDLLFYNGGTTGIKVSAAGVTTAPNGLIVLGSAAIPLRGYIDGCVMSTAGSSTTMTIGAGQATDSTAAASLILASSYNKTTSAWAVGSGNGGLDTGAIATGTWYYFYLIRRPDTGVVDVIFSTSASSPTLPANYTQYRYIGAGLTNGSSQWTKFVQIGNEFWWDSPTLDAGGAITSNTSAALQTLITPRKRCKAIMNIYLGGGIITYFSDPNTSDLAPSSTAAPLAQVVSSAAGQVAIWTNTSAQVRHRESAGSTNMYLSTVGWVDLRGADA